MAPDVALGSLPLDAQREIVDALVPAAYGRPRAGKHPWRRGITSAAIQSLADVAALCEAVPSFIQALRAHFQPLLGQVRIAPLHPEVDSAVELPSLHTFVSLAGPLLHTLDVRGATPETAARALTVTRQCCANVKHVKIPYLALAGEEVGEEQAKGCSSPCLTGLRSLTIDFTDSIGPGPRNLSHNQSHFLSNNTHAKQQLTQPQTQTLAPSLQSATTALRRLLARNVSSLDALSLLNLPAALLPTVLQVLQPTVSDMAHIRAIAVHMADDIRSVHDENMDNPNRTVFHPDGRVVGATTLRSLCRLLRGVSLTRGQDITFSVRAPRQWRLETQLASPLYIAPRLCVVVEDTSGGKTHRLSTDREDGIVQCNSSAQEILLDHFVLAAPSLQTRSPFLSRHARALTTPTATASATTTEKQSAVMSEQERLEAESGGRPFFLRLSRADAALLSGMRGYVDMTAMLQGIGLKTSGTNSSCSSPVTMVLRAWPERVVHVVSYTRMLLSVCQSLGSGYEVIVDCSGELATALTKCPSVLRTLLRRVDALFVRGPVELWVVVGLARALADIGRKTNRRLSAVYVQRVDGEYAVEADYDGRLAKRQIGKAMKEVKEEWPCIDVRSLEEVIQGDM